MRLRSEEELRAGLDQWLKEHSVDDGLWKPDIEFAERRVATVKGWHRRFCLWQWRFRGTRDCPGVMLALDRGGSCVGIAYKVSGPDLPSKIMPVWRREMRGNGYLARWVSAITA